MEKTQEYIAKARQVHGDRYSYDKVNYINTRTKIIITCPAHGDFTQRPDSHLAERGCSECDNDSRRTDLNMFIEKARAIHGDKYDYGKVNYVNKESKVLITCPVHGDFEQRPGSHLAGCGCNKCGEYRTRLNQDEFIAKARSLHGDRFDYSKVKYVNNVTSVTIICPKHGEVNQKPNNHLAGNGCFKCKASKGEVLISEILEKNSVLYNAEYRIPGVRELFYYDFYLPDYNLLIEFHGKQHYNSIDFFGGDVYLQETKKRDKFKLALARECRIPIVYFNYKHLQLSKIEFEKMLLDVLVNVRSRPMKTWFYHEY